MSLPTITPTLPGSPAPKPAQSGFELKFAGGVADLHTLIFWDPNAKRYDESQTPMPVLMTEPGEAGPVAASSVTFALPFPGLPVVQWNWSSAEDEDDLNGSNVSAKRILDRDNFFDTGSTWGTDAPIDPLDPINPAGGAPSVLNNFAVLLNFTGDDGDDHVVGTNNADQFFTNGGNDYIYAGGGDDLVEAGAGDDLVKAGSGDDVVHGGEGDDVLYGQAGDDIIDGGDGDDIIHGGDGDDNLTGGLGDDKIYGNAGDDVIDGGEGDDQIFAGQGNDNVTGGDGDDQIDGGDGDDVIDAGAGNDFVTAGAGNDNVTAGEGDDVVYGQDGDDVITGNDGDDKIFGGNGNDQIDGGAGDDVLHGGAGDDVLVDGDGDDFLKGGAGDDTIFITAGDDRAIGGEGADTFVFVNTNLDFGGRKPSNGHNQIIDFEVKKDQIDLSHVTGLTDIDAYVAKFYNKNGEEKTKFGFEKEVVMDLYAGNDYLFQICITGDDVENFMNDFKYGLRGGDLVFVDTSVVTVNLEESLDIA